MIITQAMAAALKHYQYNYNYSQYPDINLLHSFFWNSIRAVLNFVSILLQSMTLGWDLACMEWGWVCSCDRNRFTTGLGMRSNSTCLQLLWIALTAEGRGCYSGMESTTYPVNCSLLFQSSIMTFWYL